MSTLEPRPGSSDDVDPIDWSRSPIARAYPRGDGFLSYRSPGQLQRPHGSHTPAAKRMATDREMKP